MGGAAAASANALARMQAAACHTLDALFGYLAEAGYDGCELTTRDFKTLYFDAERTSSAHVIREVNAAARRAGLRSAAVGGLYQVVDGGAPHPTWQKADGSAIFCLRDLDKEPEVFEERLRLQLLDDKKIGVGYATFQVHLPERWMNTGGEYRQDTQYLHRVAKHIMRLQAVCFDCGVNFYIESHVDRVSEDPEAFCEIMQAADFFEVNGDLSHYIYRDNSKGGDVAAIMARVGHTHQRLARPLGDLSAEPEDLQRDFEAGGATFLAWQMFRRAAINGLSSRTVGGETGPAFEVKDALDLDRALVPLWRKMAAYADEQAAEPESPAL